MDFMQLFTRDMMQAQFGGKSEKDGRRFFCTGIPFYVTFSAYFLTRNIFNTFFNKKFWNTFFWIS